MSEMYVTLENGLYYLRQERFKQALLEGKEHPWDICAVAHSVKEMRYMVDQHWKDIDYSQVESKA